MKQLTFIKPSLIFDEQYKNETAYCKLYITPLERGYGQTLGNSLRRVLLSSLPGAAAVAVSINDILHEFNTVSGVREDVTEIILNLKKVVFTINAEEDKVGNFGVDGSVYESTTEIENPANSNKEIILRASDINLNFEKVIPESDGTMPAVTIVNPEQEIATLAPGAKVRMTLRIRKGVGYVGSDENKVFCKAGEGAGLIIGMIPIDSIFTPVSKCRYEVEKTRYLDNFDCDKLTLEVWTNNSISPVDAISIAATMLAQHFNIVADLNNSIEQQNFIQEVEEKPQNTKLDKKIETLNLKARSYNCLKRAQINTIGELIQKTPEEMMKMKNLGHKSLKQIIQSLAELGLSLKNSSYSDFSDLDDEDDFEDTSAEDYEVPYVEDEESEEE